MAASIEHPSRAADPRAVTRVALRNYKSIAACDVELTPLTVLVGSNGSGKSNFLDALRFAAQALRFSPDHALHERGGINEVCRCAPGHPKHFGVRLDLRLPDATGWYAFEIGARTNGRYAVLREECVVQHAEPGERQFFRVGDGRLLSTSIPHSPTGGSDRLYLQSASGFRAFRPIYDTLAGMGFYNLKPGRIRDLQSPDLGGLLKRDGSNIASVLANLEARSPETVTRIGQYLSKVAPGTVGVASKTVGPKLTLEFRQQVRGGPRPWRFLANNASDGTLRMVGVLVALYQSIGVESGNARLVGLEKPEGTLHPAAAGVLADVLHEASERVQVVVTSHSADLLDRETIPSESILAVVSEGGETKIARLDAAGRTVLREGLFAAGEMLRMNQLTPDPEQATPVQLALFRPEE